MVTLIEWFNREVTAKCWLILFIYVIKSKATKALVRRVMVEK